MKVSTFLCMATTGFRLIPYSFNVGKTAERSYPICKIVLFVVNYSIYYYATCKTL